MTFFLILPLFNLALPNFAYKKINNLRNGIFLEAKHFHSNQAKKFKHFFVLFVHFCLSLKNSTFRTVFQNYQQNHILLQNPLFLPLFNFPKIEKKWNYRPHINFLFATSIFRVWNIQTKRFLPKKEHIDVIKSAGLNLFPVK